MITLSGEDLKEIKQMYNIGDAWTYFGTDIKKLTEIESILPTDKKIVIGNQLQDVAINQKQNYINIVNREGLGNNIYLWNLTSISEKNPYVSKGFLYYCYNKILSDIISSNNNLLIICESDGLLRSFNPTPSNIKLSHLPNKIIKKGYFVLKFISRILLSKTHRLFNNQNLPESVNTAVHSWVDNRSFNNGTYTDIYLGSYPDRIKQISLEEPLYIMNVLPTCSYLKALRELQNTGKQYLMFEELISITDVIKSIILARRVQKEIKFFNRGTFPIFNEQLFRDSLDIRMEYCSLFDPMGFNLTMKYNIKNIIFSSENHIWEKMLQIGVKRANKNVRTIAYIHTLVKNMFLNYSRVTNDLSPEPDIMTTNGDKETSDLISYGFDPTKVITIGSMREMKFFKPNIKHLPEANKNIILAIMSVDTNTSMEMIEKTRKALSIDKEKRYELYVLPHPLVKPDIIKKIDAYSDVKIYRDKIEDILSRCKVAMYTDSTMAIQMIGSGVPVIRVSSDMNIDLLNRLDTCIGALTARTPLEIYTLINKGTSFNISDTTEFIESIISSPKEANLISIFKN